MRVDKAKNIKWVLKEILTDPLQTEREIAEKIWTSHTTVQNAKKEICQNLPKDERLSKLVESDIEIQEIIAVEKKKRLWMPENVNNRDLDTWEQTALKRSQLLQNRPTENVNVFSDILKQIQGE